MSNKRVSELAPITAIDLTTADLLLLADVSAHESKKLTLQDMGTYFQGAFSTGSLYGTASYALNAASASWVPVQPTASYSNSSSYLIYSPLISNGTSSNAISASWALSASYANSASYSYSGSYAITASYALVTLQSSISSAFAESSSYALVSSNAITSSYVENDYAGTAIFLRTNVWGTQLMFDGDPEKWRFTSDVIIPNMEGTASRAISASYAKTASYATTASYALVSSRAITASYALTSITTNIQASASWASSSISASYAPHNTHGVFAAITHSINSSQIDILTLSHNSSIDTSINVIGTLIIPLSASREVSESVSLHTINRTYGTEYVMDTSPIYVDLRLTTADFSGSIYMPFNLMGQQTFAPDDYMVYISASSNNVQFAPNRITKFGVDINKGSFSINTGYPLVFYTDVPTDILSFTSTDGGPFSDTAANIVGTGSNKILTLNISSTDESVFNIWTLSNLTSVVGDFNTNLSSIQKGFPNTLVTMSFQGCGFTGMANLDNTSLRIFNVSDNNLTSVPSLPSTMTDGYIDISSNPITSLPTLPTGLKEFYCNNTLITVPPVNPPNTIVSMSLSNNLLISGGWTTSPTSLVSFVCSNNPSLTDMIPMACSGLLYANVSSNNLTDASQYNVITEILFSAPDSGSLILTGNQALTGGTLSLINILQVVKGWTVTT